MTQNLKKELRESSQLSYFYTSPQRCEDNPKMTEKFTECLIRGVVDSNSLKDLIPILQSYSCPHLKNSIFIIKDYEYFTTQTRTTILKRDEYSLDTDSISQDLLSNPDTREKLNHTEPIRYLYQEGRSLIGTATVRSRRQSIVLGNIDNFLRNFDCSLRRSWEYVGCQIELLGGIKVSILQPIQSEEETKPPVGGASSPSCYVVEIKCTSSESNITLASEKVGTMATTLSPLIQLSDS